MPVGAGTARAHAEERARARRTARAGAEQSERARSSTARLASSRRGAPRLEENEPLAMFYLGQAANAGSELACCVAGTAFADGSYGFDADEDEARRWYTKVPGCAVKDAGAEAREIAASWLREHSEV